jgi:hypothetical protein
VTDEELASADIVITLGCDASGLPARRGAIRRRDDVPPPGEDFARADESIRRHVMELIDELVRAAHVEKR